MPFDPASRNAKHRRARVDARHMPFRADPLEKLGHIEARAAPDIEDSLAGSRGDRVVNEIPTLHVIPLAI
jgi:hypothetical protein